ncbi:MAG: PBP1A family penicillin-binding protein [bacterium]|nr:PBP1A family penicillin-binding protein [bacterium]
MKNFIIKNLKRILFLLSVIITVLIGSLIGIILVFQKGFPQIDNLEDIKPKVMTVIFDDQGKPIKEFAIEKRTIVRRQDIPALLENAIIASEDNQFYSHWGINFKGTFRAIMGIIRGQNLGGGSSITQQLALNLFLNRERTWQRKLKEMLMAIQIEKKYSKDQILTFYCNKIYLGASVYGVQAAARYYFGKSLKDINLAEAALFPTIMPSPNGKYNVFKRPANCLRKRNYVLQRMLELNFIKKNQYEEAIKVPLPKKPFESDTEEIGDYFVEETRKILESEFGDKRLYTGGLKVYTTLNSEMQIWAETALQNGLRALDKRRGWRGNLENLLVDDSPEHKERVDIESIHLPAWKRLRLKTDKIIEGIVLKVNRKTAIIRIDDYRGKLEMKDAKWTRRNNLKRILKKGDVALFKIKEIPEALTLQPESAIVTKKNPTDKSGKDAAKDKDGKNKEGKNKEGKDKKTSDKPVEKEVEKIDFTKHLLTLSLEQEPEVQGAIMAVENKTGEIKAMVGGYNFEKSKWNNATQALRQTGSTFKPIIYTAAIENGYTPTSIIEDEPTIFDNEWTQEPYEPQNHTGDFIGRLTLRRGFQKSRNIISAKVVEYLTPPRIVQYAKNFGITSNLKPYMSISLGAFEVTLKEMVAVYTVFPNLGYRVAPFFVKKIIGQNNHILKKNYPDKKKVLEKESAYIVNYMMQGVVRYGTGVRARHLKAPIGGKTGTTDDFTDAWFIGFSPDVTVGVWVGFDIKKKLGNDETGSRAACPVYVNFMEKYLEKYPSPQSYIKPSGVIKVKIDRYTGKLFSPDCSYPFWESFLTGTEPLDSCREEDHHHVDEYYGKDDDGPIPEPPNPMATDDDPAEDDEEL